MPVKFYSRAIIHIHPMHTHMRKHTHTCKYLDTCTPHPPASDADGDEVLRTLEAQRMGGDGVMEKEGLICK